MTLRKYSLFIALFFMITTITLMSFGVFTLSQRPFELEILYSYVVLGVIHGAIALGFAYFKKAVGLSIYFLGYASGFYILLTGLSKPNDGFLQLANLFMAFTLTIIAIFVGIIVELILWIARKKKKPEEDPHLS
jgi:hypothetical protein